MRDINCDDADYSENMPLGTELAHWSFKVKAKLGKFSVFVQDGDDLYSVQHTNSTKSGYAALLIELVDVNGKKFEVGIMSTPDGHFKGF